MTVEQLVQQFRSIALMQNQALREENNNKYNRLFDRMEEVERELRLRPDDRRAELMPLLSHPNAHVRLKAAIALLSLMPAEARQTLQRIVDEDEYPQAADAMGMLMSLDAGRYIPT